MQFSPRVLSPDEVKVWGLPEMIPIFPPDEVLAIEAKWSKKDLQAMAVEYFLDPEGDKALLVEKLVYVGALDKDGELTGLPVEDLMHVPYVISSPRKFCCRICNECAPTNLLEPGKFLERIQWLREHYKVAHPGKWGKREVKPARAGLSLPSMPGLVVPQTEKSKSAVIMPDWGYYIEVFGNLKGDWHRATKEVPVTVVQTDLTKYRGYSSDDVLVQFADGKQGIADIRSLKFIDTSGSVPQVQRSTLPEPLAKQLRIELRKLPAWKLREAYDKLKRGEPTGTDIVEQNRAHALNAIAEILWERGKLSPGELKQLS